MAKTIALVNQKGGVGKSTTTEHLGVGLAREGKRVLLMDSDPQGSLSVMLGFDKDEITNNLALALHNIVNDHPFDPEDMILHHEEGIDIITCNDGISSLQDELSMINEFGQYVVLDREYVLKKLTSLVADRYDYILIDCPPTLGLLTVNALTAADSVIVPMQAEYASITGFKDLIRSYYAVRVQLNTALKIDGIVFTMVQGWINSPKKIMKMIHDAYDNEGDEDIRVFRTYIPRETKISDTVSMGVSAFRFNKKGKATKAYEELTKEVLERE